MIKLIEFVVIDELSGINKKARCHFFSFKSSLMLKNEGNFENFKRRNMQYWAEKSRKFDILIFYAQKYAVLS